LREVPNESEQVVFDSGTKVGELAQQLFPGGVLVPYEGLSFTKQVAQTGTALVSGETTIYEATFVHDEVLVKVDILHKADDGWELYEVKSSTGCKNVYLDDIAIQWHTVTGSGLPLVRAYLVHINNSYVRRGTIDVQGLFTLFDVTDESRARQQMVTDEVQQQKGMLTGDEPCIGIGPQCDNPYPCDFKQHCWADIPKPSIFDLCDIGRPNVFELYQQGIVRLEDLSVSSLGWRQQLHVNGLLQKKNHLDLPALRAFLDGLWFPRCHLDFETTYMTPVPLFNGTRPYEQIPFQFSLHIEDAAGAEVRHVEFLADGDADPQEAFMQALTASLPENACILTWNKTFETSRLKDLARRMPHWQPAVDIIIPNVRDLMQPFKDKSFYHWQFEGSYSIKKVLPALVDGLSYDGMGVSNGEEASLTWLRLRNVVPAEEKVMLRKALLDYCRLDTLAMVKILEKMREVVAASSTLTTC
jgi:hypothetical protein